MRLGGTRIVGQLPMVHAAAHQRLWLVQEALVITDKVEHHQLLFTLSFAQTTTQLLQKEDFRLGRAQHHHRIDGRQIDAFVEQVHRKDRL
ncbi:hypothetical protein D3C84_195590 [compost metagenome]